MPIAFRSPLRFAEVSDSFSGIPRVIERLDKHEDIANILGREPTAAVRAGLKPVSTAV